jgi:hypothetical protein
MSEFVFNHVFNRESDIHTEIMSYIDGCYFDKENIDGYLDYCCKIGNLYLVKYIEDNYHIKCDINTILRCGCVNILDYIRNKPTSDVDDNIVYLLNNNHYYMDDIVNTLINNYHIDMLVYLYDNTTIEYPYEKIQYVIDCDLDVNKKIHILRILKYNCNIQYDCNNAHYIVEDEELGYNEDTRLKFLKFLKYECGVSCTNYTLGYVIAYNYIKILKFITEECDVILEEDDATHAVICNNLEILKYIINRHNILPNIEDLRRHDDNDYTEILNYLNIENNY